MMRLGSMLRCAAFLLSVEGVAHAGRPPPAELAGTWDVEHVAVDRADQMHWEMPSDDPQLVARELVISADEVWLTSEKEGCKDSTWQPQKTTWAELFGKGFRRPPGGGRSTRPTPEDFEMTVSKGATVTAFFLCSPANRRPADAWLQAKWVALESPDTLVMHYSSQVLLVLKRRAADAKPRASFPCCKATTPTEQAICGSFDLAGWDRSVAAAYRQALERNPDDQPKLREEQKQWLAKRDKCGGDVKCIDDLLWRRVDDLTQE